ncbi:tyrosine-type recombinase/integrase [Christensenella intestinihominis]|uniref:tyrosine-type recombinase/integrase n=1 Tax=Christensenella intestinihominis TaxID=1851429 RepID=UPI000832D0CC|nr:tyrosine-type recombinase/integrase [Christensenella intestinihominis]
MEKRRAAENRVLFCDWINECMEANTLSGEDGYTVKTYFTYAFDIDRHILPYFVGYYVDEITRETIDAFIDEKLASGRLDHTGGLSPSVTRKLVIIIRRVMEEACAKGLIQSNPCNGANLPRLPESRICQLDDNQFSRVKETVLQSEREYALCILVLRDTGISVGEGCGLYWEDFRYRECDLHVHRTAQRIFNPKSTSGSSTMMTCSELTGAKDRYVPVPAYLADILRNRKYDMRAKDHEPIFSQADGKPRDPKSVQSLFWEIAKKLELPSKRLRILRDTYAIKAIKNGMNLSDLAEIMGIDSEAKLRKRYEPFVEFSSESRKRLAVERIFGL